MKAGTADLEKYYNNTGLKKSLIDEIQTVGEKYNVDKIVLFGSRARGDHSCKSDIDIAVYGCDNFPEFSCVINEELWTLLELDIVDMNQKYISKELVEEIEKDGVIIYEKV